MGEHDEKGGKNGRDDTESDETPPAGFTDNRITLAKERTRLSRQRTTLAYIRTGFASFLFGAAIIGLFPASRLLGALFIAGGVVALAIGGVAHPLSLRRVGRAIIHVERDFEGKYRR